MAESGTAPRRRRGNWKTAEEREQLERLVKVGKAAAYKRRHAQVLLKVDEGELGPAWSDERTAEALDVTPRTVRNVRKRLVEQGLEAAVNRKRQVRPSRQIVLDGEKEARLIALACSKPPAGHARWTLRLLADRLVELRIVESVSLETVRQSLKKTNFSPGEASTGAFRHRPMPNSSARWKTFSRLTNSPTIRQSPSCVATNARTN